MRRVYAGLRVSEIALALFAASRAAARTTKIVAHGIAAHLKCKQGYELNDAHTCVKAGKT